MYCPGIRRINYIARLDGQNSPSYYLYNGHGDVVQTAAENGTVENQYDYDIFGQAVLTIESYGNAIRYAGEFYDSETGLYYLRARYYDPSIGRFISEDSYWGEDNNPLSLNLYTYCENDPIRFVDPSGNTPAPQVLGVDNEIIIKKDQNYDYSLTKKARNILKLKSRGDDVRRLQLMLIDLKMLGKHGADGKFGNKTLKAVKDYQRKYGLKADGVGVVGKQTWASLIGNYDRNHTSYIPDNSSKLNDSYTNEETFVKKTKSMSTPLPANWDKYNANQKVQYYLNKIGFKVGNINGDIGAQSSSALIIFQFSQGISITGIADATTIDMLRKFTDNNGSYNDIMGLDIVKNWKPQKGSLSGKNGELNVNQLTVVAAVGNNGYLQKEAAVAWALMVNEARKDPNNRMNAFSLKGSISGYRSIDDQRLLFKQYGGDTNRVAYPGKSNHGMGLAVDLNVSVFGQQQEGRGTTYEVNWLANNAQRYGFTPYLNKDNPHFKDGSNNYYESWHWNYLK